MIVLGYLSAVLLPPVGLMLGIVAATRPQKWASRHGVGIILVSVVTAFAGAALVVSSFERSVKATEHRLTQELSKSREELKSTENKAAQEGREAQHKAKQEQAEFEQRELELEQKARQEAEAAEARLGPQAGEAATETHRSTEEPARE